ncbi:hypothetical protein QQZ08_007528 [Neonectria magnoliae]|uniref:Uncharacterized protein n=1 Tax=Neonectria magnoliae TaxID=2732573 RepID=A0ABR1HY09_9HYPO
MSLVESGLLRRLYSDARSDVPEDSQTAPWVFWQTVLQQSLYQPDAFAVTIGRSREGSLPHTEMAVRRYDEASDTLSGVLCVRCKHPSLSVRDVEQQALDAAQTCMQRDGLQWIWAMTTVGVSFRMWYIDEGGVQVVPVSVPAPVAKDGESGQYIDADSSDASVFSDAVQRIKLGLPLHVAPVRSGQEVN